MEDSGRPLSHYCDIHCTSPLKVNSLVTCMPSWNTGTLSKARSPSPWIQSPQWCCITISHLDPALWPGRCLETVLVSISLRSTDFSSLSQRKSCHSSHFCFLLSKPFSGHLYPDPYFNSIRRQNLSLTMPWESRREGVLFPPDVSTPVKSKQKLIMINYPASAIDIITQISRDLASLFLQDRG